MQATPNIMLLMQRRLDRNRCEVNQLEAGGSWTIFNVHVSGGCRKRMWLRSYFTAPRDARPELVEQ